MTRVDPAVYRFGEFKELGFTDQQASVLSISKDSQGILIYPGDVGKMLNRAVQRYEGDRVKARDLVFDILSDDGA